MAGKATELRVLLGAKFGLFRKNIFFFLQRTRDDWFWRQYYVDKRRKFLIKMQTIDPNQHIDHGPDLAAAKFVIGRLGGRVRDERSLWIEKVKDLPPSYMKSFRLTAIEATNTNLLAEGTDNFAGLDHLESLNLSSNKYLDDFACDQISREFRKSQALAFIDFSNNEQITVHGLNILLRIPSLRHIKAINTRASTYQDIDLFVLSALDERGCKIQVQEGERQLMSDESEQVLLLNDSKSS